MGTIAKIPDAPTKEPPAQGEMNLRERLLAVLEETPPERPRMTYEEFLAWADEDTLAEWVNGEIIMTSPASLTHQDINDFLTGVLRLFVQHHDLGKVISAPFQMKLPESSGREPDVLFVSKEHLERLKPTYLDGPADLVVEIISPESVGRDRGEKYVEYAQAGIPEYWLIDPEMQWAEFYQLQSGRYRLVFQGREGRYESQTLPGFWLEVGWLWQDPLPAVDDALLQIMGESYARRWIQRLREQGYLE